MASSPGADGIGLPESIPVGAHATAERLGADRHAEAERAASSHKIQGTAQGAIQNSMAYLRPRIRELQEGGLNVTWRLQIHDSIILTLDENLWEVVDDMVMDALTQHHRMNIAVPMTAKGSRAKTWGELK